MSAPANLDNEIAVPPRYWWLKRLSVALAVVLILLVALRLFFGAYAQRKHDEKVAELRDRGEPALAIDLAAPNLADADNAAVYLQRAASAVAATGIDSPRNTNLEYGAAPPYPPEWWAAATASYEAIGPALTQAREARSKKQSAFPRATSPMLLAAIPSFNNQRALASALADAALYLHLRGNDHEAMEIMFDLYFQAGALTDEPMLISGLVGRGILALADANMMAIAPGLSMTDAQRGLDQPAKRATPQQLRALIAQLLDTRREQERGSRTLITERVAMTDTFGTVLGGGGILKPVFQLQMIQATDYFAVPIRAAGAEDWPAVRVILAKNPVPMAKGGGAASSVPRSVFSMLVPSLDRAIETDFRIRTQSRMTAVSLAAQLFKLDHGRWPASLEEMVPAYLPTVPRDPMAAGGAALQYIVVGNRPVVFSVGQDGVGRPDPATHLPAAPSYGWINYLRNDPHADDQYIDISRFAAPPPATQPQSP